jgi:hypothetical protein
MAELLGNLRDDCLKVGSHKRRVLALGSINYLCD